jgi:A/G-specific adenine glycosylase
VKRETGDGRRERGFAGQLLDWWAVHGRHDLPWQRDRSPYRVWLSEIMLQQTRVGTVIDYFQRFTARFSGLKTLADADLDEVMALWSGLGYYTRARNLHKSAGICVDHYGGRLPDTAEELQQLPGIGRSTANAIIAQAHDQRAVILDGNVKRVLARHAAIEGWPGRSRVARVLWEEADLRTPSDRARDYTQAIMDLGSAICRPRNPDCWKCPVSDTCRALKLDRTGQLPEPRPRIKRPHRSVKLAIIENEHGDILLERRPAAGIWGGLWSLPELGEFTGTESARPMDVVEHHFTHFILHIQPFHLNEDRRLAQVADDDNLQWTRPVDALELGLPRPIRSIIEGLVPD